MLSHTHNIGVGSTIVEVCADKLFQNASFSSKPTQTRERERESEKKKNMKSKPEYKYEAIKKD